MDHVSVVEVESAKAPGVTYTVARMSFGRRVELIGRVRDALRRMEHLEAGGEEERMGAGILRAEIDRLYLQWGLKGVTGLTIDGMTATPELLAEAGPEELFREALAAVRAEAGLSEAERKN